MKVLDSRGLPGLPASFPGRAAASRAGRAASRIRNGGRGPTRGRGTCGGISPRPRVVKVRRTVSSVGDAVRAVLHAETLEPHALRATMRVPAGGLGSLHSGRGALPSRAGPKRVNRIRGAGDSPYPVLHGLPIPTLTRQTRFSRAQRRPRMRRTLTRALVALILPILACQNAICWD